MSEAGIGSGQRAFALLAQNLQLHGGLFVGGRMRQRVGVAAGQNIDGLSVEFMGMYSSPLWTRSVTTARTCSRPRREVS